MAQTSDPRTIGALLRQATLQFGDRTGLVFPAEQLPDGVFTFARLHDCTQQAVTALSAMGLRKGDHIGLLLHNSPQLIILWLAAATLGLVTVPFNARYRARELSYVIRQSRIRILLTSTSIGSEPDLAERVREALPGTCIAETVPRLNVPDAPELERLIVLDPSDIDLKEIAISASGPKLELPPVSASDIVLMMYTSGTTAEPKGCLIRHETVLHAARALALERYHLGPDDRMWNPLPMFHMSALHPFTACLWSGCAFLSMTHFDAAVAARQVMTERVTILYPAFPTIANDLLHAEGFSSAALSDLRRINCVAPPDGLRRLQQSFPQAAVTSVYGLTEAGGVIAYGEAGEPLEVRIASCGRPFEGIEVRIGPAGDDVMSSGHVGEIQLRGWCLFAGYFEQPQASLDAMTEDGWLRTGDLGSFDAQGRIQYRGRIKDIIKVGGENVSALEIESVLMREPAVKLAQVIGVADERFGEVPVAFVELHPQTSCSPAELLDACRVRLAGFKLPRRILFVTEWPMSATKIQKHRLRERLQAGGSAT